MPLKRYRAGINPVDATEDYGNGLVKKRIKSESLPASIKAPIGRRVVQPQIICDNTSNSSVSSILEPHEEENKVRVRKLVEAQMVETTAKDVEKSTSSESESGSSSDDSSDSSDGSDEEEPTDLIQIAFVPKAKREDTAAKEEEKARQQLENQSKEKRARQQRSREIVSEAVARTEAEENGVATEDEADYPDDDDESGNEEDLRAWKEREISRIEREE